MSADAAQSHAFTDWTAMLAILENELGPWLVCAVEPPAEPEPPVTSALPFEIFEQQFERLQAYLSQAEQSAEQALAPLTAQVEAFERWLQSLNETRGKLVERTAGGV
jgi:hypothetical protein